VGITRKICLVPSRLPTRFCGVWQMRSTYTNSSRPMGKGVWSR
jgi:hypothetical protein